MKSKKEIMVLCFALAILANSLLVSAATVSVLNDFEEGSLNSTEFFMSANQRIEIGNYIVDYYTNSRNNAKIQFMKKNTDSSESLGSFSLDDIEGKVIAVDNKIFYKFIGFEKDGLKVKTWTDAESQYHAVNITTTFPDHVLFDTGTEVIIPLKIKNNGPFDEVLNLGVNLDGVSCFSYEFTKDSYRFEKIKVESGEVEKVELKIKMSDACPKGDNKLNITVGAEGFSESLTKLITFGTSSGLDKDTLGIQLSKLFISGKAGEELEVNVRVSNLGEGELRDAELKIVDKNKKWSYEFSPEKIETIKSKEYSSIKLKITLPSSTEPGDYFVDVKANSGNIESKIGKLRVNIKGDASTSWIGIVLIVMVLIGLGFFFKKVGRR